jgi:protein-glucosylgalactosylhydroxylysine glucosidase
LNSMKNNSFFLVLFALLLSLNSCRESSKIDRYKLVTRHNIENSNIDSLSSVSVGNGEFAFTVDITGLQTFPEFYSKGISLGTMSEWGWHTGENPENFQISDLYKTYDVHGRNVDYVHQFKANEDVLKAAASDWLRSNPHRIHLGMIGLQILKEDGKEILISDIQHPVQKLNLWTGEIDSRFNIEGVPVHILTVCHPDYDMISVKVISDLVGKHRLRIKINFPLGVSSPTGYDFNSPDKHTTKIIADTNNCTLFDRIQDKDSYNVLVWRNSAQLKEVNQHLYYLEPYQTDSVYSFSCQFMKNQETGRVQNFSETETASKRNWEKFWTTGGAVDFSKCTDPRATELERRVILSLYLTKIQCSGSLPPAETGLTYNSWFGKFHLEMHWWHAVHFALWQRTYILEKQMDYYFRIFDNAKKTAVHQGYEGVRWPKMTGPDGRESPSTVGTYLIWQQPHVIFLAELLYKNASDKTEILKKYKKLVFETADFMASYAWPDNINNRYTLGPVLIPAQESLNLETTLNPSFELVYWYWGLKTAQEWRRRMSLDPVPKWNDITEKISTLPVQDGLYLCSEDTKDSYQNPRYLSDHPIVSAVYGIMPKTKLVDPVILGNTLDTIMKKWNWKTTWGWDFPMLAMSAASIGRGEQAIDFLLMDAEKNRYLFNGHNYQNARLSIYLPGNGGLLTAVAKMCVSGQFPYNGKWKVKWENLNKYVD